MSSLKDVEIEELEKQTPFQNLALVIETIENILQNLRAWKESEDSEKQKLLKVATVFQVFLLQTFAEGKKPAELKKEDWKNIAEKISQYAIMGDGQQYSEFVFSCYAHFIDVSAEKLSGIATDEAVVSIKRLAESIRYNTEQLHSNAISEIDYIEGCMWISLEAMIKLLACSTTPLIGPEFSYLVQAIAQLSFEYGRAVLFAREQKILQSYIDNQYVLDEKLQSEYEEYLSELNEHSERFQRLINNAFAPEIHDSLVKSAELARAAGVKEEELLLTVDDVDAFFLD